VRLSGRLLWLTGRVLLIAPPVLLMQLFHFGMPLVLSVGVPVAFAFGDDRPYLPILSIVPLVLLMTSPLLYLGLNSTVILPHLWYRVRLRVYDEARAQGRGRGADVPLHSERVGLVQVNRGNPGLGFIEFHPGSIPGRAPRLSRVEARTYHAWPERYRVRPEFRFPRPFLWAQSLMMGACRTLTPRLLIAVFGACVALPLAVIGGSALLTR